MYRDGRNRHELTKHYVHKNHFDPVMPSKKTDIMYVLFPLLVPSCGLTALHAAAPCQVLSLSSMDLPGWLEMALGAQHGKGPGCMVGTILMHEHTCI